MGRPKGSKNKKKPKQRNTLLNYSNTSSSASYRSNILNQHSNTNSLEGNTEVIAASVNNENEPQSSENTEVSAASSSNENDENVEEHTAPSHRNLRQIELEERKKEALNHFKKISQGYEKKHRENNDDYDSDLSETSHDSDDRNRRETDESACGKWKYLPLKDSVVQQHLNKIKEKVLSEFSNASISRHQQWFPPAPDPISFSSSHPDDWYLNNVWSFVWAPLIQYKSCILENNFTCKKCGLKGKIKSKGCRWRPTFHLDKITWVLHRKFEFSGCGHSITSIDHQFVKQLPQKVAERFPFIFEKSIGAHESLIQLLMSLSTKSVLFGTFCNGVNEVHQIKCSKSLLNYLDNAFDIAQGRLSLFPNAEHVPHVFSACLDRDKCNGISLKEAFLKRLFLTCVKQKESHMQQNFQLCHDHGCSGDHAHKFSKQITSQNRSDKIFTASYTMTSMLGEIVATRLTFTKSNDELDPILSGLRAIRDSAGVEKLKRCETDDASGDGNLWKKHFPELTSDVRERNPLQENLGFATIDTSDFVYIPTSSGVNDWAMSVINDVITSNTTCVGIDCEWNYLDGTNEITRTLQLSFPNKKVAVVHLSKIGMLSSETFPLTLKNLLELNCLLFCGRQVPIDCSRIEKLGVKLRNRFDLRDAELCSNPEMNGTSLEELASECLGLSLNKSHRDEDFSQCPLPLHLQQHAALDALASRKLGEVLCHKNASDNHNMRPGLLQLEVGDKVSCILNGKAAARGNTSFCRREWTSNAARRSNGWSEQSFVPNR